MIWIHEISSVLPRNPTTAGYVQKERDVDTEWEFIEITNATAERYNCCDWGLWDFQELTNGF